MKLSVFLLASGVLIAPGVGVALAGPCSDQIAELSRLTSADAGPTATGAISPGATTVGDVGARPGEASQPGTGRETADGRSGTREMSAAAGQVATSAEDVRRQQQGQPTLGQAASQASDRLPLAKAKLDQARMLDEQGNAGCMALVNEARQALEAK